MYEESGFLSPHFQWQSFPMSPLHKPIAEKRNLVESTVWDYNLGGEGDLFKAPEPIMEEPVTRLDPITLASMINSDEDITRSIKVSDASSTQTEYLLSKTFTSSEYYAGGEGDLFKAPVSIIEEPVVGYDPISMISCSEDAISAQMVKVADIESFESDNPLSEVLCGCKKDLMDKSALDESFSKVLDLKLPATAKEEDLTAERNGLIAGSPMKKSISSGSLSSMDRIESEAIRTSFLDFHMTDFGAATGMRRTFSEGDMQTLHSGNALGHFPFEKTSTISNCTSEDRQLRLSRYRFKKTKRNFRRNIKYACRKALADSQPRVRGRFARSEEAFVSNALKCTT